MTKRRAWRYKCDYCKKVGGAARHMEDHEKVCTLNPDRECRMCRYAGGSPGALADMKAVLMVASNAYYHSAQRRPENQVSESIWQDAMGAIRALSNCPACILAALRQAPSNVCDFDFKKESKALWERVNEDRMDQ